MEIESGFTYKQMFSRCAGFSVLIMLVLSVIVIGCNDKKATNDPPLSPSRDSNIELSESDLDIDNQWKDFWGFSAGNNHDGYHLEVGTTIYHLKDGTTKVYDPDNVLIMNVNDDEMNHVAVPGGGGFQPATHGISVPNGSFVTGDGFITKVAGIEIVDMNVSFSEDDSIDQGTFSGFWRATGADITPPECDWEHGKIYNYDWYSIAIIDDHHVTVRWDNGLLCSDTEGLMREDKIHLEANGTEVVFRIYDETTAFVTFYEKDKSYVKRLTKERDDPTVICA